MRRRPSLFLGSDRLTERVCSSLQTVTDLRELSRREVDALLLDLRAFLLLVGPLPLAVSALAKRLELTGHLLDGPGELGQLFGDDRRVLSQGGGLDSTPGISAQAARKRQRPRTGRRPRR